MENMLVVRKPGFQPHKVEQLLNFSEPLSSLCKIKIRIRTNEKNNSKICAKPYSGWMQRLTPREALIRGSWFKVNPRQKIISTNKN
jgi:hypothetical protein